MNTTSRMTAAATFLALLSWAWTGVALGDPASTDETASLAGHSRCLNLLGTNANRTENQEYREDALLWILEEASGITISHTNLDWEEVQLLELHGVTLLGRSPEDPQAAVIQLSRALAERLGCEAALYQLRRDDNLGQSNRVLAVFDHAVLLDHDGRLGYILTPEEASPAWLLAWKRPGVTFHPTTKRSGRSRAKRPRPKPKRRRPRRRR